MDIRDVIKAKCAQVEPILRDYVKIGDPKIQQMIIHPIDAGGKRIRPALTLLAAEAVGGDPELVLPAAAAVELLHTFTLVHDDIMDHDLERRGRPTVHAIWGEEMGIIVGDTLYSSAFKALIDVRRRGVKCDRVLDALEVFVKANGELQEGQIMDMLFAWRQDITEQEYMTMVRKKTGALLEACVEIGAILGGADKDQLNALYIFGLNCGIAFQIKDDVLDLTANQKDFGKPVGSDIRSGKRTLIIVHALEHASPKDRKALLSVLGREKASGKKVNDAISILKKSGSIAYADGKVNELMDEATKALDFLPKSQSRESLRDLARFLVERRT